jgi:WD40 repeat protein
MLNFSRISAILIDDYDNNTVYVASRDQTMSILDVKTQSSRRILPLYEPIESAVFSKKLKQIVTVGEEGILKFWDPIRGTEVKQKKLSRYESVYLLLNVYVLAKDSTTLLTLKMALFLSVERWSKT